jgi:mannose-1-phosphate guanylyltransferase
MTNIILCGGSGTRLWPLSRTLMPKQFVKLFGNKSMFQLTVERNGNFCDTQYIVSNSEQYFLALDQLAELHNKNNKYMLEPVGRNTAPAIALACLDLDYDEIVLVTPSDHLIKDQKEYERVLDEAKKMASKKYLVTFGITPTFAETGYGYIEASGCTNMNDISSVNSFHEKPNFELAQKYLESGNYYWNSGMFCFKAGVFLEELKKYSPDIYNTSLDAFNKSNKDDMIRIKLDDMIKIPSQSIDYAVMEQSDIVKVIPSNIDWSDMGSFDALAKELPNDKDNNLILSDKPVELIGIQDSVIVNTGDVLLVAKKGCTQDVKKIVQRLNDKKSSLATTHLTGYRPWGSYTILDDVQGYKIKRIEVKPGGRLSLQRHKYRNEHWVVVSGIATVTINDSSFLLNENESTYIEAGDIHRLSNDTDDVLTMVEVQVGPYTGEDDIERLEDDYNRGEI